MRRSCSRIQGKPPATPAEARERLAFWRGVNLRNNHMTALTTASFAPHRDYLVDSYKRGAFLRGGPESRGQGQANPMSDPAAMEGMMSMMKGNMMMMIPQTLIMSWINAFFAGFVILRLPFPLTIRFKSMLQSGVMTRDLDVRWVSSLSWYFLCLFGLQGVFYFLLGAENQAAQVQQMQMGMPAGGAPGAAGGVPGVPGLAATTNLPNPFPPAQDPDKLFLAEVENLEVLEQFSILDGVEERLLARHANR